MRRLITVLGTGDYQEATYRFGDGNERRGRLFAPLAACHYSSERIDCLATDAAWGKYGEALVRASEAPVTRHPIPPITVEDDLWQVFRVVVELVQTGDELVVDFTHGLRSLPLVGAAAASVAALVKGARITALVYGAFDQRVDDGPAPVVDLRPFFDLLRWQAGCEEFARTGLAGGMLAALKGETRVPGAVSVFQRHAEALALALTMMDPRSTHASARDLRNASEKVLNAPTGERIPPVPAAMGAVAQWVGDACEPLSREDLSDAAGRLRHEAALIIWYRDRGHYTQAATLLREWLVSLVGWTLTKGYPLERDDRSRAEAVLNYLDQEDKGKADEARRQPRPTDLTAMRSLLWTGDLVGVWQNLTNVRNSIAHCAMLPLGQAQPPSAHKANLDELIPDRVRSLAEAAGLGSV